jgi:hypothetical protein
MKPALTITRHLETLAYEWYCAVLKDEEGHMFSLLAETSAELEILWFKVATIPFDSSKIQHVVVVKFQQQDKPEEAA